MAFALSVTALGAFADSQLPDFHVTLVTGMGEGETFEPTAINAAGEVVGTLATATGHHAALWSPAKGLRLVKALPGSKGQSFGAALNDAGDVAGLSGAGENKRAFVNARHGDTTDLDALLPPELLSGAIAIDEAGEVLISAHAHNHVGVFIASHAYVWRPSDGLLVEIPDLPGGYTHVIAHGMNRLGHVTGFSDSSFDGGSSAFIWRRESGMQVLTETKQGSGASGTVINSSDVVAGDARFGCCFSAALWTAADGWRALGWLPNYFNYSEATGINEAGDVVGISMRNIGPDDIAVIWPLGGRVVDLNKHIDPADPLVGHVQLTAARGINDRRQIVVSALVDGLPRAVVLTPAP